MPALALKISEKKTAQLINPIKYMQMQFITGVSEYAIATLFTAPVLQKLRASGASARQKLHSLALAQLLSSSCWEQLSKRCATLRQVSQA